MKNLPLIRLFLAPVMDRQAREHFNYLHSNAENQQWLKDFGRYHAIGILRSVVTTRTPPDLRIRQGLLMLLDALKITPEQTLKSMSNQHFIRKLVLKPGDRPELLSAMQNYIKWLGNQMTAGSLAYDIQVRAVRESQERLFKTEQHRKKLVAHGVRRIKEKAKLLAEKLAAEELMRTVEKRLREREEKRKERERNPKRKPMRWLA